MTKDREQQMLKASQLYPKHQQKVFVDGALWSDKHPSQEWIDKACKWITQHIEDERYKTPDEESYRYGQPYDYFETNMFIDAFRKAMEKE